MSFVDHLEELRWHIFRALGAIIIIAILTFVFSRVIFDNILFGPRSEDFLTYKFFCNISNALGLGNGMCLKPANFELQNIQMAGQFLTDLKVSIILGFIISFPYVFWEMWRFIKPGLLANEQQVTRGLVFYSSFLFLTGVLFGYFVLAPFSINFFANYQVSSQVTNIIALDSYVSIISTVVLAAGIMFELPMVVYSLSRIGIVTPKGMRQYRKHSFVAILIISAIITPADIWTQLLVTVPVYFLYEFSILVSAKVQPQKV
ncbi:UNVERIFIED_CONTAM: hypothetical protein GTU68_038823 [Idotea baltica]|nr:hypothetical protein [Idotea baltica]